MIHRIFFILFSVRCFSANERNRGFHSSFIRFGCFWKSCFCEWLNGYYSKISHIISWKEMGFLRKGVGNHRSNLTVLSNLEPTTLHIPYCYRRHEYQLDYGTRTPEIGELLTASQELVVLSAKDIVIMANTFFLLATYPEYELSKNMWTKPKAWSWIDGLELWTQGGGIPGLITTKDHWMTRK